ncbi:type II secretion system protein [Candidatus Saccharibacteria bacterium]|nr:type II secretion system protein [Candidatus Saccharibacteria bacterium]
MNTKPKKGFTIIEVVLVLAIAGLIFLMVFIALPNMQRSQRDTQRRNDYSALSANMTQYMTNNNGSLPSALTSADSIKYINTTGNDPNGLTYELKAKSCKNDSSAKCGITLTPADKENASTVYVITNAQCEAGEPKTSKSSRAFAIYGNLETGSGTYCQSNS